MSALYKIKKLLERFFYMLLFLCVGSFLGGHLIADGYGWLGQESPMFDGFLLSLCIWGVGTGGARAITHSPNNLFLAFTPITELQLFREGLRNHYDKIITGLVLCPVTILLGLYFHSVFVLTEMELMYIIHTFVNMVLFVWAVFLVGLCQSMHPVLRISFILFPIRHLFLLSWRFENTAKVIVLVFVILVFKVGIGMVGWVEIPLSWIMEQGVVGEVFLYLLSPGSSFFSSHPHVQSSYTLWIATFIPLMLIVQNAWGIWNRLKVPHTEIEYDVFEGWLEERGEFEEVESQMMEAMAEGNAVSLGDYEISYEEELNATLPVHALAYDESYTPEQQVIRNKNHWQSVPALKPHWVHRSWEFLIRYAVCWLFLGTVFTLLFNPSSTVMLFSLGVIFLIVFVSYNLYCFQTGCVSINLMNACRGFPITWNSLRKGEGWKRIGFNWVNDLLVALLAGLLLEIPLIGYFVVWLHILFVRGVGGMSMWHNQWTIQRNKQEEGLLIFPGKTWFGLGHKVLFTFNFIVVFCMILLQFIETTDGRGESLAGLYVFWLVWMGIMATLHLFLFGWQAKRVYSKPRI